MIIEIRILRDWIMKLFCIFVFNFEVFLKFRIYLVDSKGNDKSMFWFNECKEMDFFYVKNLM